MLANVENEKNEMTIHWKSIEHPQSQGETQEPGLRKHWCQETPSFSGAGAEGHLLSESTPALPCPWVPLLRVMFLGQGVSHWPHMDPGLGGGWQSEGLFHQDGIPRGRIDPSTLAKPVHSSVWGWVSLSWGHPEMSQSPYLNCTS